MEHCSQSDPQQLVAGWPWGEDYWDLPVAAKTSLVFGIFPTLPFLMLAAYKHLSWWKENGCLVLKTAGQ